MGKLFLSGGGDKEQTQALDRRFAEEAGPRKPLLYIPIAMDASMFDDGFQWIQRVFKPLGIKDITMWTNLKNKTIQDLDHFSAVYIGGGNTFQLLKHIRDAQFSDVFKNYFANGGIIYGGSAGAVILGQNIMTCSHLDKNTFGVRRFQGLQLAGEYSIWCHYSHENDPLIKQYIKKFHNPVIALTEETGALVSSKGILAVGSKPACVFRGERKFVVYPDDFIHL
ncbi:type 1 glutamine amidotransferase-like domain-containing protein [Bacillus sp. NSP9.1]|nr:type 1 glutamine amidotransferase-like domain-containing protein [Bacillus sp. NSP9.1]